MVFYHGTDARIVRMKEKERKQYINGCNIVINYLFKFYKPLLEHEMVKTQIGGITCKVLKQKIEVLYKNIFIENNKLDLYYRIYEKSRYVDWYFNGSQKYQYSSFYVTGDKDKAKGFAYRAYAGGEFGMNAYYLIQGLELISFPDFNPSQEVEKAIESILDFAMEGKEEPVVFELNDLNLDMLLNEDGTKIDINTPYYYFEDSSFRYTGNINLELDRAEFLPRRE